MKHNVGSFDAAARTLLGFAVLVIGHHLRSWWALVGIVPLLSAVTAFCPLYAIFRFDTCAQDAEGAPPQRSRVKNV
jgi:hypothetical protein